MKFINISIKNFKPYYFDSNNHQAITLFDQENRGKNITLNIGQNGYGKTSISEAIKWCIFGEACYPNWEDFVNSFAINVTKEKKEKEISICVELTLEINGEQYKLVRIGRYDIENEKKIEDSKLNVIFHGEAIKNSLEFVDSNFLPTALMDYFIFDADDILKKFEIDQEKTIKDNINKIIGVEKLDKLIESFDRVNLLYENEKKDIEKDFYGDLTQKIENKNKDILNKDEAIRKLKDEINDLKIENSKLFKGSPSSEIKRLRDLIDYRDNLAKDIDELNEKFKQSEIIHNADFIFSNFVLKEINEKLKNKKITKNEFENASSIIKLSIGDDYSGIYYGESENAFLIKEIAKIHEDNLDKMTKLEFGHGEGYTNIAFNTLQKYSDKVKSTIDDFKSFKKQFSELNDKLNDTIIQIHQIRSSSQESELKKKYDRFIKNEEKIDNKESLIGEIQKEIGIITEEIAEYRDQVDIEENAKKEIDLIDKKMNYILKLKNISSKTRKSFLNGLLENINKTASEFLRNSVKDVKRFNSIEIDSNYKFTVKQKSGEALKNSQINKGSLQLSLMAFFFAISEFLGKKIPYVIDNPLLRLDPGHDKRLIEQLSKSKTQVVLLMLPQKEYNSDSYQWLKPYVNSQNWISREDFKGIEEVSFVENKNSEIKIDFDTSTF